MKRLKYQPELHIISRVHPARGEGSGREYSAVFLEEKIG